MPSTLIATFMRAARRSGRTKAFAALQMRIASKSRRGAAIAEEKEGLAVSKDLWPVDGRTMRWMPSHVVRGARASRPQSASVSLDDESPAGTAGDCGRD